MTHPANCQVCGESLEIETAQDFTGVTSFYWCVRCGEYRDPAPAPCAVAAPAETGREA